jgi:very-short-patch-repair endonuclease
MTLAESDLWRQLRGNRLGGFHWRRQQVIDEFIADFYCHVARLIVEVDGDVHRDQVEYDHARDVTLATRDLLIMGFTNTEIFSNIANVLVQIVSACQKRTRAP